MKRIERITSFVPSPASTGTQLWTASVFTTALFLCVALAFCQEGKQVTTNEAGEFTTETGVRGTVTVDGKPLAGATVTIAPRESATASPERIRSYTVGSRVTDFPAGTIDLLTPEAAYALGNRIIADDNADKIERLRHYTAGMSVPQDIERWITSMTPNVRSSLMNAEILHVFIYRDKHAMVIAEVVKGESYNNRLFSKRDGHWFNTGGSGLFGGKSAEAVVEMLEGHFARLADGWDREPRESATASPQSGDTVLGSQTPDAEASWRAIHSPEHLRDLQGIGAAMRMEDGHLIVENVIPGSSAYVSGEIKQGDRIQGIGQGREGAILNVSGLQMPDAVQLIRGNRGTIVRLEILPKGEDTSKIVELVRDSIPTTIPPLRDSVPTTLPPPDGGFVTDGGPGVSGFTHMVVFQPTGNFNPQNPMQFLALFRERLIARGPVTGYFRTKPVNGKLVGSLLTGDPVGLEQFITSYPELEFVRSERLTKESFEAYEKTPQLSLSPADGG